MADNTEMTEINNFSIQDTMSMGAGNQQLLNDLLSPETGTASADDLTPIINEVTEPSSPPPSTGPANNSSTKNAVKPDSESNTVDNKKNEDPATAIMNFLGTNNSDDNDDSENDEYAEPKKVTNNKNTEITNEYSDTPDDDVSTSGTQFSALAKDLYSLGVFTSDEDEEEINISTPEEFLERFNTEKQKGSIEMINNFIGQFGEDYQNAFQAIFVNGVNPKEYFQSFNKVQDFASLDLSVESNQKLVLQQALKDQGFEEEDIEQEIERLSNYGDLETVAQRHHKVLIKKEATELDRITQKAQRELQQKAAIRNEYINNVQYILSEKLKAKSFDGIPLNPKLASELHDFLLVDKYKTPTGETLTDFDRTILELKRPENHATKVKLGLLIKLLEKDPTLSTIQKTGVTNKTNAIFSEVVRQGSQPRTQQQQKEAAGRWFK